MYPIEKNTFAKNFKLMKKNEQTFIKREIKNLCTLTLREVGVAKFTITLDKRDFVVGRGFEPLKPPFSRAVLPLN